MTLTHKYYLLSSIVLIVLDIVWIQVFMSNEYAKLVPKIQGSILKTNFISAGLAYFLMLIGLWYLVLPRFDKDRITVQDCLKYGFLFGIVVYGVYDFTCGAVFENWDFKLAIVDILWGGLVYFLACYAPQFL